ncbi:MAG: hypothetical protein KJ674_01435 [Nanoarchaeota archaeon]|nr:hypothetical protein [Nanoarchaeota archaeon]
MKRSTCKVLLWIGIVWLIVAILISSSMVQIMKGDLDNKVQKCKSISSQSLKEKLGCYDSPTLSEFNFVIIKSIFFLGIPSWILIIIALVKWNSEKEKKLKDKAKVQVHIKGKVKDLK